MIIKNVLVDPGFSHRRLHRVGPGMMQKDAVINHFILEAIAELPGVVEVTPHGLDVELTLHTSKGEAQAIYESAVNKIRDEALKHVFSHVSRKEPEE